MKKKKNARRQRINNKPDYALEYLDKIEKDNNQKQEFKQSMRTIKISSADKYNIGMLSSGWDIFLKNHLDTYFKKSLSAGYTKANEIAIFWNNIGFKTASGQRWNSRLVNIAKEKAGIKHGLTIIN